MALIRAWRATGCAPVTAHRLRGGEGCLQELKDGAEQRRRRRAGLRTRLQNEMGREAQKQAEEGQAGLE